MDTVTLNIWPHSLDETLRQIERVSRQYKDDTELFKNLPLKDLFRFIATKIEYKPDPDKIEFIMRPLRLLQRKKGDCDDKTIFALSTFWNSLNRNDIEGFGYSVVANKGRSDYHHIFPFVIIGGKIRDFDATYPDNVMYNTKDWGKRYDKILYLRKK